MASEARRAFISYSRLNKEFATKLAKGLRAAKYPIWFDQLDIPTGARWDDEVEKALRECNIFMIILTPASIGSENVKDEIGYAIDRGKRILPVLLEECDVPLRLRRFQYVDFTTKSFGEGFESAKELLSELIDEESIPLLKSTPASESNSEPVASKAAATPVTVAAVSAAPQKKPASRGLVIGIIAIVAIAVCAIAGLGIWALSNLGASATQAPAVSDPITEAPAVQVNVNNVNLVRYPGGEFVQTDVGAWKEVVVSDGTEFYFQELGRNEEEGSVYLWEETRDIVIKLDLIQGQIWVDNNDGAGYIYLYYIESVEGQ